MDRFGGHKPLFAYENAARYFGDAAYEMPDADLFAQTELSARGLDSRAYYDTEIMQKMKSQILSETIKYWRGFGMSGHFPIRGTVLPVPHAVRPARLVRRERIQSRAVGFQDFRSTPRLDKNAVPCGV